MELAWKSHLSLLYILKLYGSYVKPPWDFHRSVALLASNVHATSMELSFNFHGSLNKLLLDFHIKVAVLPSSVHRTMPKNQCNFNTVKLVEHTSNVR